MSTKTFLEIRDEQVKKLNVQFLEHLKTVMQLNTFCPKFEFVFQEQTGITRRDEGAGYYTEIRKPAQFNYVIFSEMVRNDPFFVGCEVFHYENKEGFYILVK